jgi:hypothetical protein
MQIIATEATLTQRVALGGMQTERDNADHRLGPSRGNTRRRLEIDEETIFIPIESILSIKHSSEIKKGHTEYQHVLVERPQHVKLSCCGEIKQWCCKTFCCCCNNSDRRVHNGPEKIVTTISGEEAERKIIITIEYIRYSNIHTPSHVRVLAVSDQTAFYKENFHQETLQFYLLDSDDYQQTDFDLKHMQASILCRLVTDLKAMMGHYPDESTLQTLISKHDGLAIGDPPRETLGQLTGLGQVSTRMELAIQNPAKKNRP